MLLKFRTQQIEMLIENLRAKFTAAGLLVDRDDDEDDVDGNDDDDDDGSSSMLGHGLQTLVLQGDEMAQEEMKKLGNDTHAAWDKFRALVKSVQAAVKAQRYAKHDGDAHMTTVSWLCPWHVCGVRGVCVCVQHASNFVHPKDVSHAPGAHSKAKGSLCPGPLLPLVGQREDHAAQARLACTSHTHSLCHAWRHRPHCRPPDRR